MVRGETYVSDFVYQLLPERHFGGNLPLNHPLAHSRLPTDAGRPGYAVAVHATSWKGVWTLAEQLRSIFREGFVVQPKYSTFATVPHCPPRLGGESALVITQTPVRVTTEEPRSTYGEFEYGFVEPLIGGNIKEVQSRAPEGAGFWCRGNPRLTHLSFVPPAHLRGVVRFPHSRDVDQFMKAARGILRGYQWGDTSELDAVHQIAEKASSYPVERDGELLDQVGRDNVLGLLAAAYTQQALLEKIDDLFRVRSCGLPEVRLKSLSSMRPEFVWTKQVRQDALEVLESKG